MKHLNLLIILILISFFNFSCVRADNSIATTAYQEYQNGTGVILDVREREELLESGKAKGALWIPMSKIRNNQKEWEDFLNNQAKNKSIYIYCASGGRAGAITESLIKAGMKATNLGGLKDLKSAGLEILPFDQKE